jgi:hypothetical protein
VPRRTAARRGGWARKRARSSSVTGAARSDRDGQGAVDPSPEITMMHHPPVMMAAHGIAGASIAARARSIPTYRFIAKKSPNMLAMSFAPLAVYCGLLVTKSLQVVTSNHFAGAGGS